MGLQPFADEFGIQILTQVFDEGRVSRHDIVDRVSREKFATLIDPELGSFGNIFAKNLRTHDVFKGRRLVERVPWLSTNAGSSNQLGANSGLRKVISEFSKSVFRDQVSVEIIWNQYQLACGQVIVAIAHLSARDRPIGKSAQTCGKPIVIFDKNVISSGGNATADTHAHFFQPKTREARRCDSSYSAATRSRPRAELF